jgi:hypothetical protein
MRTTAGAGANGRRGGGAGPGTMAAPAARAVPSATPAAGPTTTHAAADQAAAEPASQAARGDAAPALAELHVAVESLATAAAEELADTRRRGEEQANAYTELAQGVAGAEAANADMQGQLDSSEAEARAERRVQSRAIQAIQAEVGSATASQAELGTTLALTEAIVQAQQTAMAAQGAEIADLRTVLADTQALLVRLQADLVQAVALICGSPLAGGPANGGSAPVPGSAGAVGPSHAAGVAAEPPACCTRQAYLICL